MMEDTDIIELYWQRSERAITASDEKYGGYCHTISYNILRSALDADECVNDTWLHAWNAMPPQRPFRLAAFFARITRNLSLDRWRRNTADKRGGGQTELALEELTECVSSDSTEEAVDAMLLTESLERFLRGLSDKKCRIFLRRYWYLSSVEEIARDYGMTRSGVRTLLHRLRLELKAHLEREGVAL